MTRYDMSCFSCANVIEKDGAPVTNYFNIVGRNDAAVQMAALPAGARVEIAGRLSVRSWQDERGYKRTIFEIYVLEITRA